MEKRTNTQPKGLVLDINTSNTVKSEKQSSNKKKTLPLTYKNYIVKEESQKGGKSVISNTTSQQQLSLNNTQTANRSQRSMLSNNTAHLQPKLDTRKPILTKATNKDVRVIKKQQPRSKSGGSGKRATSQEIKKEVQVAFNNFMCRLQDGKVEDDDSLLQDSYQEPDKEAKQVIMHSQQAKREQERIESLERARAQEIRRLENLAALDQKFKSQMKDFQKLKAMQQRQKVRDEARKKKQIDKIVKTHQGSHLTTEILRPASAKTSKLDQKSVATQESQNSAGQQQLADLRAWIEQQMRNENMFQVVSSDDPPVQGKEHPKSIFDQSMPKSVSVDGSGKLSLGAAKATEKSKSNSKSKSREKSAKAQNKLEQKKISGKFPAKKEHPMRNLKYELPGNRIMSDEEKAKLPNSRKNRYGVFPPTDVNTQFDKIVERKMNNSVIATPSNIPLDNEVSVSTEQVSDDSCDQVPVRESSKLAPARREILNKPAYHKEAPTLPGALNIKKMAEEQARKEQERKNKAALIIQRWLRGHWGRHAAKRQRQKLSRDIEEEYGRFDREVKRTREYDLKRYLAEKKKIREKTGLPSDDMDSIAEMIGESSSTNKLPKKSHESTVFMELFKQKAQVDKDPLSLISVFAKRHSGVPQTSERKSRSKERRRQRSSKPKTLATSESIIEEEYPEDFEDSVPKDSETIEEDLPSSKSSGVDKIVAKVQKQSLPNSKGLVPAVGAAAKPQESARSKKRTVKESLIESIADEIIDEVPDSTIVDDEILEESGLESSKKNEVIRSEYDDDRSKISEAKQKIEARNRLRFGLASAKTDERSMDQVKKEEVILGMGIQREQMALERQRVLGDLVGELKEYEKAHISTAAMDRMEKVVVASLAQKDQLIMAQRLAELEREKAHAEEISRLREEQIKMMTQMMLLGFGQGVGPNLSEAQRLEAVESIKKIIEKPITIKQETVHVNYSVNKVDSIDMSLAEELATSQSRPKKKSYLEEFEESRSKHIKEDIPTRQNDFSSSRKSRKSETVIEDEIPDEVADSIQESIAEEIEQSKQSSKSTSQSQSALFQNNAFQEFKTEKLKKAKGVDLQGMHQILSQIELEIIKEKEERETDLKNRLKKKKLNTKTYDKKVKELEKWVKAERKDIQDRKAKVDYDYKNVQSLISDINVDRKALAEKIGVSPKRSRQSDLQQVEEESRDSEELREAIRQSQKLRSGLATTDPESRYLEKKRQAANALLEEKEKAIQKGLISKLAQLEEENADELMKRALDMNVQSEINKRFEMAKKMIEESSSVVESQSSVAATGPSKKKNVYFAPNVKTKLEVKQEDNLISEESISESIQGLESVSVSIRSAQAQPTKTAQRESSEISSDRYSDDFAESASKGSEKESSRSTKLQTLSKLQAKAKDLEESNAYSDRFDEESYGQAVTHSQHKVDIMVNSAKKMESVKEESIDESIEIQEIQDRPDSQVHSTEKSGASSLPSEDVEVKTSGKSTDWQIQVKEQSKKSVSQSGSYADDAFEQIDEKQKSPAEIEEDIQIAAEQKEIDDLQSVPDEIGKSQSENDIFTKADKIADEMIRALLENYKNESGFELSMKVQQPDEDEFKNKFPWTLDKIPEVKPKPVGAEPPAIINRPVTPKKVKSERELADDKFKEEHAKKQAKRDEHHLECQKWLDFLCKRVDLSKLIESINTPIVRDPLKVLKQIQAYEDDESSMQINDSSEAKSSPQQILPYNFFCKVDREFVIMQRMQKRKLTQSQAEESDQLTVSQEDEETVHNIHHYALFEALNDALDQERPYHTQGQPMPWSSNSRTFKKFTTPEQGKAILEKAKEKVIQIEKTLAGTNLAPLPSVPAQTQDEDGNEIIPPLLSAGEEERKNMQRHQKLAQLMKEDIQENELQWIDYEVQDTQARFDLADMILHQLTGEIVSFLQQQQT